MVTPYILPEYDDNTTVCSTMFCYNRAEITNDPAKPPFCDDCKEKKLGKGGKDASKKE